MEDDVRCPYCKQGTSHVLMIGDGEGRFICAPCGHVERRNAPDFRCFCDNCQDSARALGVPFLSVRATCGDNRVL
jgi:hypothetical protein